MAGRTAAVLGILLAICAGTAIVLSAQAWYLRSQVIDTSAFAGRAVHVAAEEGVHDAIAAEIADRIAAELPRDLVSTGRVRSTVDRAMEGEAFDPLLRSGARRLNAALFHDGRGGSSLRIRLDDLLGSTGVLRGAPAGSSVDLVAVRADSALADTNRAADLTRVLTIALPLFALVALAAASALTRRPRRLLAVTALAAAVVAAVMLPLLSLARTEVVDALRFASGLDPRRAESVAGAIWDGFFGGLHTVALVALAAGAVAAAGLLGWDAGSRRRDTRRRRISSSSPEPPSTS
jgi:hypothetical protein